MILHGDALTKLRTLKDESVQCVVTSPPYWGLRDYGVKGQLGLEKTPEEYVERMVEVFREVRRVLRRDGTLWLNLGDCYASAGGAGWQGKHTCRANRTHTQRALKRRSATYGLKPKDLVGIPWRVAFALQADGWYLRSDIIWHKPNPMPESVTDRPTKGHEYLFLFSRGGRYRYDAKAIREKASENTHARYAYGFDTPKNRAKRAKRAKGLRTAFLLPGVGPKAEKSAPGSRQNASFQAATAATAATAAMVEFRNRRTVWSVVSQPFRGAHFATFPPKLIEPCILAGTRRGDTVLDPFFGSGTTGLVALQHGRKFIGIELSRKYVALAKKRIRDGVPSLTFEEAGC